LLIETEVKGARPGDDLREMSRSRREDTEALYRRGVAMWAERRLTEAGELFRAALAASPGLEDGWWFSTSRAMAQVAMELGDLDTARRTWPDCPAKASVSLSRWHSGPAWRGSKAMKTLPRFG
jgi:hypothetical protein